MLDLRTFLESAKRAGPEGFLEIKERHDIKFEVCALLAQLEKQRRTPVLLFSDLNTLDGGRSPFPLLANTFASREACALALGLPAEKRKRGQTFTTRLSTPKINFSLGKLDLDLCAGGAGDF